MRHTKSFHVLQIMLIALILLVFAETVWLSMARYNGYNAGMDLESMSQAIWSATQGQPLLFTLEGVSLSRLGRHVEVFYFLLAPLYALFATPATLLIIQAALFCAGAVPVYRLAHRRLQNRWAGTVISGIYLFYPVAQTAVLFDFHGDTLAMPFLLFALDALDRRAWRGYAVWVALALSCKFYVAIPVIALGIYLWRQNSRSAGAYTALGGFIWGATAFFIIRPLFAPPIEAIQLQATSDSYLSYYFGQLDQIGQSIPIRLLNALIIYLPAMILGRRATGWLLLSAVTALPALLSTGPGPSYDYRYHHYALAVPFLLAGIIYGAAILQRQKTSSRNLPSWGIPLFLTLTLTLLLNSLFVDAPLNLNFFSPASGSGIGLDSARYKVTERDKFRDTWLENTVPKDAPIMTDGRSALRLLNRKTLFLTRYPDHSAAEQIEKHLSTVDFVVTDALNDFVMVRSGEVYAGGINYEFETISLLLQNPSLGLLQSHDGMLLFGRSEGLAQRVEILESANTPPLKANFDDLIGLIDARIETIAENHYHIRIDWVALQPLDTLPPLIAVSRPEGLDNARIVHLPTLGLHSTTAWEPGQVIREEFEITFDDDIPPGSYPLWTGWYDSEHPFAANTDSQSRIGAEVQIGILEIR